MTKYLAYQSVNDDCLVLTIAFFLLGIFSSLVGQMLQLGYGSSFGDAAANEGKGFKVSLL